MIAPEEAALRRRQAIGLVWIALVILSVLRDFALAGMPSS